MRRFNRNATCGKSRTDSSRGCSASCEFESSLGLWGSALGGSVQIVVDGVPLLVATSAGQSAEQVVALLAAAIAAEPALAGVGALALGNRLVTTGSIGSYSIDDPGLVDFQTLRLPVLGPLGGVALVVALLGVGSGRFAR